MAATPRNRFDASVILDGTRRWLGELIAEGAHTHYEQMYISSIEPRARLFQTLR
ncbi:hypothetical protein [Bradyrhizobium sp.]|uniref:hypothetical protein n=1 Tax=Bradyrhizobium sp. TaxID=376 RepID=UPI0040376F59